SDYTIQMFLMKLLVPRVNKHLVSLSSASLLAITSFSTSSRLLCCRHCLLISLLLSMKEIDMSQFDFDVGIIGGGPAGAGTAAYLAKAGLSCVVFERELFPRPHVGESLVPSSTRVFKEIGFLEHMDQAEFPRKYGA